MFAEQGVVPADRVERGGVPGLVAGGHEQIQGNLCVAQGLGVAVPPPPTAGRG